MISLISDLSVLENILVIYLLKDCFEQLCLTFPKLKVVNAYYIVCVLNIVAVSIVRCNDADICPFALRIVVISKWHKCPDFVTEISFLQNIDVFVILTDIFWPIFFFVEKYSFFFFQFYTIEQKNRHDNIWNYMSAISK